MDSIQKQRERRRQCLERIIDAITDHVDFQICHLSDNDALDVLSDVIEELQEWGNEIASDLERLERN